MLIRRVIPVALLLMLLFGSTQAQNWIGVRSGFPWGANVHYGLGDAFGAGSHGRVSLALRGSDFGVGFDFLNTLSVEPPFEIYVGGGPLLLIGGNGLLVDLHAFLGGEFVLSDLDLEELGIFAELGLGGGIGFGSRAHENATVRGALGFNYRF
ncbi:MAG: hypothetical protein WD314_06810 [Trueperaceae bacterium]